MTQRIVFFIIFFILLTPREYLEPHARLVWVVEKESGERVYRDLSLISESKLRFVRPFIGFGKFGYVNQIGEQVFAMRKSPDRLYSYSKYEPLFVEYRDYGKSIVIQKKNEVLRLLRTEAYPFLSGNGKNILMVTGEAEGFFVYSISNGIMRSAFQTGAPVIDVAQGKKNFYLGALEGILVIVDGESGEFKKRFFNTSGINIIKKIAVSQDERMIAFLSGSYPEYLILDKNGQISKIRTTENKRKKSELVFSPDSRYLGEETENGFHVYSTGLFRKVFTLTNRTYFSKNRYFQLGFPGERTYLATFHKDGKSYAMVFAGKKRIWAQSYDSEQIYQEQLDSQYFLIEDDRYIRLMRFEGL